MGYITDLIVFAYILYGVLHVTFNVKIKQWYVVILYYIAFKMVFNYKKCTVSYIECKIRNVKKEDGYIYRFLDQFINLRHCRPYYYFILAYTTIFSVYYFYKGGVITL
jgi:hypothetical protein